jgi:hypothetical protein
MSAADPTGQAPQSDDRANHRLRIAVAAVGAVCLALMMFVLLTSNARRAAVVTPSPPDAPPGPSPSARFEQVAVGMTVEQVEQIMGPGEAVTGPDGVERREWRQPLNGRTWVLSVTVKDGTVTAKHSSNP